MKIPRRKKPSLIGSIFAFVFAFAFVGVIGSCLITIGIWPGEIKLLAPLFCSDAQPDAFVVADTYSPQPGETTTNFTLYCMGPRGDATDKGFMLPFLAISVVNGVVLMTLGVLLAKIVGGAGRRRLQKLTDLAAAGQEPVEDSAADLDHDGRGVPGPGSTAGPFVN